MRFPASNPIWIRLSFFSILILATGLFAIVFPRKSYPLVAEGCFILGVWLLYLFMFRHVYYINIEEGNLATVQVYEKFRVKKLAFEYDEIELVNKKEFRGKDHYVLFKYKQEIKFKLNSGDGLTDVEDIYTLVKNQLDKSAAK